MNADRSEYLTGETINEQLDNLGTNAQLVTFNVTPYTVDEIMVTHAASRHHLLLMYG